ncbi:putative Ig domain protein [compost metagenome]
MVPTPLLMSLALTAAATTVAGSASGSIDYGRAESWLAYPGMASVANLTPKGSGYTDLQAHARADVFYVHPTTGMREDVENVPIDDPQAQRMGSLMVMSQATPFNGVARIFAPRYRQMTLPLYSRGEQALQAPMNRAYADVRQAFEHYVKHENNGRPFFLVAHSQGSNHALRLLSEAIQGTPLERRLVAAYLPGNPTPRSVFERDLTRIPPCTSPVQTGCVAIWGVFGEGFADFGSWERENVTWEAWNRSWRAPGTRPLVNVNPLTWTDEDAPASMHRGAVPFGVPATHFTRPRPKLVGVRNDGRYDFVSPMPLPGELFNDGGIFGGTNYHVFDISLFWADLRENARRRLASFLLRQDKATYPLIVGPIAVEAKAGSPFTFRIETENLAAAFKVEGLPAGLMLDAKSGELRGVPREAGTYPLILTATNAAGSDTSELALTVLPQSD